MKLSRSLLQNTRKRFDILETHLTRVGENLYSTIEYVSFNICKR